MTTGFKITGEAPPIERIKTGLFTFDYALGDQTETGFPLGKMTEIYGPNGIGKSTFVQSLAFILARETKSNIAYADYEGINTKVLIENAELNDFDGEFYRIQDLKDENVLQELIDVMWDKKKNFGVGIVDAVGSISPAAETNGDLGDSNMGRRAFLLAQFSRKANHILINKPDKSMILINHQHPRIGMVGMTTPGGETKKYIASIRIQLARMRRKNSEEVFKDGSYVVKGQVIKNRWGLEDREFYAFILAGKGVHVGLTAMYDCVMLKLATVERNIVKIGDTTFGNLYDIIDKANNGNTAFFNPFIDALSETNLETREIENTEDKDDIEE
jgi:recombination protein RecA